MTRNMPYPDTIYLADLPLTRQLSITRKAYVMKRTEKVEIRVSLEEKQTLTALAKQDGESVSGLIRGLVEKYISLNSANTVRKLPKWQIAAGLIAAAFVGHGLTLIPMHLHDRGHQSVQVTPTYMVHGAIGRSGFGVDFSAEDPKQRINLPYEDGKDMIVRLSFEPTEDGAGKLNVTICETASEESCIVDFNGQLDVGRGAPSVLGNNSKSGKPIHIFVQEMA